MMWAHPGWIESNQDRLQFYLMYMQPAKRDSPLLPAGWNGEGASIQGALSAQIWGGLERGLNRRG